MSELLTYFYIWFLLIYNINSTKIFTLSPLSKGQL
jgi:hypothetical protein